MPKRNFEMEIGNITCRFGDEKVLIDLWDDVVSKAFLDNTLVRTYDETRYFFYKTQLVVLSEGENKSLGVAGRFIKDTILEREQLFDENKGLFEDHQKIRSAPSAAFLFIVGTHRLLYVKETKDAPLLETFSTTLYKFVSHKYKEYINDQYEENKSARILDPSVPKLTKTSLRDVTPPPTITLVAVASSGSLESFVATFDKLQKVEIHVLETNDEIDNNPFFANVRKKSESAGSADTTLVYKNADGLKKEAVVNQVNEATNQGNHDIRLTGKSADGGIIIGNNEDFRVKAPIQEPNADTAEATKSMFNALQSLLKDKVITIPDPSPRVKELLAVIIRKLRNQNAHD